MAKCLKEDCTKDVHCHLINFFFEMIAWGFLNASDNQNEKIKTSHYVHTNQILLNNVKYIRDKEKR